MVYQKKICRLSGDHTMPHDATGDQKGILKLFFDVVIQVKKVVVNWWSWRRRCCGGEGEDCGGCYPQFAGTSLVVGSGGIKVGHGVKGGGTLELPMVVQVVRFMGVADVVKLVKALTVARSHPEFIGTCFCVMVVLARLRVL